MGTCLNPGNEAFRQIRNGIYVDKTGLIDYMNRNLETPFKMTCFSRPRRFGKSFAAKMICAYYDKSCDSRQLFEGLEISRTSFFERYLNQFDVIYLDITRFISIYHDLKDIVFRIQQNVIEELRQAYPASITEKEMILADALVNISRNTGNKFIIIIDEWDALFREAKEDDYLQREYVQLLRGLFKAGPATDETIAAAYMTGILPIKKYGTQSALTDFREYTMVYPAKLARYVGFTEDEVKMLCQDHGMDFDLMHQWYDGYSFSRIQHIYSPNSVMNAVYNEECRNYWTTSETYESLKEYISQNFDGLKDSVIQMLGGQHIGVDTSTFQNDLTSFHSKDDILTLLIHLGYLAYDDEEREVYIPDLEVADAFRAAVKNTDWKEVSHALAQSEKLLKATIRGDCKAVADALEELHSSTSSILKYHDENSLACAITIAYYTAQNYYEIVREFPAGKGFADLAFIPRRNTDKPAMIIELKYEKDADSAIAQIKQNRYSGRLNNFGGRLLLVGINYDKKAKGPESKKHTCIIEEVTHG